MKSKTILPVAQPQNYGVNVLKSNVHLQQVVDVQREFTSLKPAPKRIAEVDLLLIKHRNTNYYPILERVIRGKGYVMSQLTGRDWLQLARQIMNQAQFAKTANPLEVKVYSNSFQGNIKVATVEISNTLTYMTDLFKSFVPLGKFDIHTTLRIEYNKFSADGAEAAYTFIDKLHGFLPEADIPLRKKVYVNQWVNKYLPESEWMSESELHSTMHVSYSNAEPHEYIKNTTSQVAFIEQAEQKEERKLIDEASQIGIIKLLFPFECFTPIDADKVAYDIRLIDEEGNYHPKRPRGLAPGSLCGFYGSLKSKGKVDGTLEQLRDFFAMRYLKYLVPSKPNSNTGIAEKTGTATINALKRLHLS